MVNLFAPFLPKIELYKIRRLPLRKILRSIHLGLTFAFAFTTIAILFFFSKETFPEFTAAWKVFSIFAFFLLTYFGGWSFIAAIITWLIDSQNKNSIIPKDSIIGMLALIYTAGFLFGYILSQIYNELVYRLMIFKKQYKIAFFYNNERTVNIIKSPNGVELEEQWKNDEEKEKFKLYNYNNLGYVTAPFTITIIANPEIKSDSNSELSKRNPDPIIEDLELFLLSVDKLLYSLKTNSVIGRPEIWSRVRVITIFDPHLELPLNSAHQDISFAQKFEFQLVQNKKIQPDNIIAPSSNIWKKLVDILEEKKLTADNHLKNVIDKVICDTDVLYVFSAHEKYNRASALYADGLEDELLPFDTGGIKEFSIEPVTTESSVDILSHNSFSLWEKRQSRHEEGVLIPGKIALNVLTATRKTYIHEFAHAMSSINNGAITDEYFDTVDIDTPPSKSATSSSFYVNRLERVKSGANIPGIPRTFMRYNDALYNSDIDHPSAEEDWLGYFPERKNCSDGCIMDRTYGSYQFDDLLSQFIYDRMMVKVNRQINRKRGEE